MITIRNIRDISTFQDRLPFVSDDSDNDNYDDNYNDCDGYNEEGENKIYTAGWQYQASSSQHQHQCQSETTTTAMAQTPQSPPPLRLFPSPKAVSTIQKQLLPTTKHSSLKTTSSSSQRSRSLRSIKMNEKVRVKVIPTRSCITQHVPSKQLWLQEDEYEAIRCETEELIRDIEQNNSDWKSFFISKKFERYSTRLWRAS